MLKNFWLKNLNIEIQLLPRKNDKNIKPNYWIFKLI